MKELILKFNTQEELQAFVDTMNNALVALNHVYHSMTFGCDFPVEFRPMEEKYTFDELDELVEKRLTIFRDFYNQLLALENI